MVMKIRETYKTQTKLDQKQFICNIIIKALNIQNKERLLRTTTEKNQVTYKGRPIRIILHFLMETMKDRKSWLDMMNKLRNHGCQSRLQYPAKLSISIDRDTRHSMTNPDLINIYPQILPY